MNLHTTEHDDQEFVQVVSAILEAILANHEPDKIATVHVDNWFDHKWLGFEGMELGAVVVRGAFPLAIPPFHPNRILDQTVYHRISQSGYEVVDAPPLHIQQHSANNIKRYVFEAGAPSLFLWWSGKTITNGRGSLMVYHHTATGAQVWYASFAKQDGWVVHKTKMIGQEVVRKLMKGVEPKGGGYSHVPRETLT